MPRRHPPTPSAFAEATLASATRDALTPAQRRARAAAQRKCWRLIDRGELTADPTPDVARAAEAIRATVGDHDDLTAAANRVAALSASTWLQSTAIDIDADALAGAAESIRACEELARALRPPALPRECRDTARPPAFGGAA